MGEEQKGEGGGGFGQEVEEEGEFKEGSRDEGCH